MKAFSHCSTSQSAQHDGRCDFITVESKHHRIKRKKTRAWGPEKHSSPLIHPAWSKENNTRLCYSSGLFFFSSLVWTAGVSLCVSRYLTLAACPLLCRDLHSSHMCCVSGKECRVKFKWENRRWMTTLIMQLGINPVVKLLLFRKILDVPLGIHPPLLKTPWVGLNPQINCGKGSFPNGSVAIDPFFVSLCNTESHNSAALWMWYWHTQRNPQICLPPSALMLSTNLSIINNHSCIIMSLLELVNFF